jgi:hypothetical protein
MVRSGQGESNSYANLGKIKGYLYIMAALEPSFISAPIYYVELSGPRFFLI